jgi:nitroreductase
LSRDVVLDFFEAIRLRRSVRAFTDKNVSDEEVMRLIEAARLAPSAGNIQPWSFVIVKKTEIKNKLYSAALHEDFIREAPVVIVVCTNEELSRRGYGSRGANLYCIQDAAAATENILLAACAMELGACWIGAFNEDAVGEAINAPGHVRPVAIVPVGHPAERPSPRHLRPLGEIMCYETF